MDAAELPSPVNVKVDKLMELHDFDRVGEIEARSLAGKEASASHKSSGSGHCRIGMRFVLEAKDLILGALFGFSLFSVSGLV